MTALRGFQVLACLAGAAALAGSGCHCAWFGLGDYSCEEPGDDCGPGRVCAEISTGEFFCVVAGGTDGGTDAACLCDDGDPCNGVETCSAAGDCVLGVAVDCSMFDADCNTGVCDPMTGTCSAAAVPDGTACDDDLFCTDPDGCELGSCTGEVRDCSMAGDICAAGGCDEAIDACTGNPLPDGAPCNDGVFCTVGETCQSATCTGGTARDCSGAADQCNTGSCDEVANLCVPGPFMDGTACDDTFYCTDNDVCTGGFCMSGPARDCSFLDDQCNTGMCDDVMDMCLAVAANESSPCDDGMGCTMGTTCTSGSCSGGSPVACPFVCATGGCVVASNVPASEYAACDASAPVLTLPMGATVIIQNGGPTGVQVGCQPHCGDGSTMVIDAQAVVGQGGGNPDLAIICVSVLNIPSGVTVTATANEALLFLVDGAASVAGTIDVDGGEAGGWAGGPGGPGGFDGADRTSSNSGSPGFGPCPGLGGSRNNNQGGGGGGGGHGGTGGDGGDSRGGGGGTGAGGAGGGTCGVAILEPLLGGSGGAAGADGFCGTCGYEGGGGGGAIQISSRISIDVSGTITAEGGGGYGVVDNGGGGGGGSGGAILLEAPTLSVSGSLRVDGGTGGTSEASPAGAGASGGMLDGGDGTDATSNGDGGPGGGGGGGRVRLNSAGGTFACGGFVSPTASCSDGALVP